MKSKINWVCVRSFPSQVYDQYRTKKNPKFNPAYTNGYMDTQGICQF